MSTDELPGNDLMASDYAQPHTPPHASGDELRTLAELIKDARTAMMVTLVNDARGIGAATTGATHPGLRARPMYTYRVDPETFDGTLYFMTGVDTAKVQELVQDRHVLLTYADDKQNIYAAVAGEAEVEKDTAMINELWNVHAQGWWPGGPVDPNVTLIRVRVHAAEYWKGPSNTRYMIELAKAVVTGKRIADKAGGEHETMRL